jgi:hypothetical protein
MYELVVQTTACERIPEAIRHDQQKTARPISGLFLIGTVPS